jgi:hypothetical protein
MPENAPPRLKINAYFVVILCFTFFTLTVITVQGLISYNRMKQANDLAQFIYYDQIQPILTLHSAQLALLETRTGLLQAGLSAAPTPTDLDTVRQSHQLLDQQLQQYQISLLTAEDLEGLKKLDPQMQNYQRNLKDSLAHLEAGDKTDIQPGSPLLNQQKAIQDLLQQQIQGRQQRLLTAQAEADKNFTRQVTSLLLTSLVSALVVLLTGAALAASELVRKN